MDNGGTFGGMELERDPYAPDLPPGQDELPSEDGVPMETARHRDQMNHLIDVLGHHLRDRDDVFVGGNMFVYFSLKQAKNNDFRGPDFFAVLDVPKKERKSWVAWEENGRLPDVVIELLSDSTQQVDRVVKKQIYERTWHVRTYVLYDPFTLELEAYRHDGRELVPVEKIDGCVPVPELGLSLGVRPAKFHYYEGPALRWMDRDAVLPTPAEDERARADEARARVEAQRTRAEAQRTRADEQQARADEQQARAELAERRIAELEALMAKR